MNVLKLMYRNAIFYTLFVLFTIVSIPVLTFYICFLAIFSTWRRTMKRLRITIGWWALGIIKIILSDDIDETQNEIRENCLLKLKKRGFKWK